MSPYNDIPRHYRLVNFIGLAVSAGTLTLITLQPALEACSLCTVAQLSLLATSTLFFLAWLQNPQRTGQRTYATFNLLLSTPVLFSIVLSFWLQNENQVATCTNLLNTGLDSLTHYFPVDHSLIRAVSGSQPCHISNQTISGIELSSILIAAFTVLTLTSWVQLNRKRQERSLFL